MSSRFMVYGRPGLGEGARGRGRAQQGVWYFPAKLGDLLAGARILGEMPSYRLGQASKMLGVSVDTVRRMVDDGRLLAVRTSGKQRLIDGESLAALAKPRRREAAVKQSARNRFPGI